MSLVQSVKDPGGIPLWEMVQAQSIRRLAMDGFGGQEWGEAGHSQTEGQDKSRNVFLQGWWNPQTFSTVEESGEDD